MIYPTKSVKTIYLKFYFNYNTIYNNIYNFINTRFLQVWIRADEDCGRYEMLKKTFWNIQETDLLICDLCNSVKVFHKQEWGKVRHLVKHMTIHVTACNMWSVVTVLL